MDKDIETTPLAGNALRQYINARQTFASLRAAETEAKNFRGSMLWREVKGHSYLIRTSVRATQTSLGPKTDESEAIYNKFMAGKAAIEERRTGLVKALDMNQRMNKALFVGRVDDKIIDILNGLRNAGLDDNFTVVGTNALYAYEAAAGVRIESGHLATNDLDLLWDNRRKLSVAVPDALAGGMIGLLRRVDKTFALRQDQLYTAVNADGYEVDILRRMGQGSENEPAQLTKVEDDFWAVKARNADWLLSAPKFREVVVGSSGRMAEMITVDPRAFALFKLWMAGQKDRDPQKRLRDANQARVVVDIINQHLPQLSFDDIHVFPANVMSLQEITEYADVNRLAVTQKPVGALLSGPILAASAHHCLQSVGRGEVVIHDTSAMGLNEEKRAALVVGAVCEITYSGGGSCQVSIDTPGQEHAKTRGHDGR
jgi:hypothetical protein